MLNLKKHERRICLLKMAREDEGQGASAEIINSRAEKYATFVEEYDPRVTWSIIGALLEAMERKKKQLLQK